MNVLEQKLVKISDYGPDCQITNMGTKPFPNDLQKHIKEGWTVKTMIVWKEYLLFLLERKV